MKVSQLPQIITEQNITVVYNGKAHSANSSHINFKKIEELLRDPQSLADDLINLIDIKKSIVTFSNGNITIDSNGVLRYKTTELHNCLAQRMLKMLQEGFNITPLANFLENVMKNPSRTAVQELYEFLEKNNLPITPDGKFLAYKRVQSDYTDFHTGTMNNSLGSVLSVERNSVDDNRNNTCSYGLHFCSLEYLSSFHSGSGHIMIVQIDPKDVVSFPPDYNVSKGRTCSYTVVGEHELDEKQEAFSLSVCDSYFDQDDRDEDDFGDEDEDAYDDSSDFEDNY